MRISFDCNKMRGAVAPLVFISAVAISSTAMSADDNGKFAIKGGGLQTCENFVETMREQTNDVALYGGWIEGFVTAQNQHIDATFDVAPWQTTNTLLQLTKSICEQAKPDTRFIDAFAGVFRILFPSRITQEDEVVGVSNGEAHSIAYREILKRVQQVLRDEGYTIADETGTFDNVTVRQLMDYQTKKGLVPTGLPDQPTLYPLFFKK